MHVQVQMQGEEHQGREGYTVTVRLQPERNSRIRTRKMTEDTTGTAITTTRTQP